MLVQLQQSRVGRHARAKAPAQFRVGDSFESLIEAGFEPAQFFVRSLALTDREQRLDIGNLHVDLDLRDRAELARPVRIQQAIVRRHTALRTIATSPLATRDTATAGAMLGGTGTAGVMLAGTDIMMATWAGTGTAGAMLAGTDTAGTMLAGTDIMMATWAGTGTITAAMRTAPATLRGVRSPWH